MVAVVYGVMRDQNQNPIKQSEDKFIKSLLIEFI